MKRNLIIFLFTLLLGGITCFNYSYASTVNVSESVCKNIEDEWKSFENFDTYTDTFLSDADEEIKRFWWYNAIQNQQIESYKQDRYNELQKKYQNWLWPVCNATTWCLYFHDKCVACPWIRLNTDIPFIGNCILTDSQSEIFPVFIGWLIKFATSLLLLVGFICIIVGGVMVACGKDKEGKDLIKKVVYAMALLWASGVILKMINPNFFN